MNSILRAKLMGRSLKDAKGFTLIELLVVIVIVGVLSGVAVPTFLSQIRRSRAAEAQSGLASVGTASEIYRFDNGVYPGAVGDIEASGDLEITWANLAPNYGIAAQTGGGSQSGILWRATGNVAPYTTSAGDGTAVVCDKGLGDQSGNSTVNENCNI
ncbi:MAG: type IV pilin protein [Synechococcus sp.]